MSSKAVTSGVPVLYSEINVEYYPPGEHAEGMGSGCAELILKAYNLTIPNEIEITIGKDKNVPAHARH